MFDNPSSSKAQSHVQLTQKSFGTTNFLENPSNFQSLILLRVSRGPGARGQGPGACPRQRGEQGRGTAYAEQQSIVKIQKLLCTDKNTKFSIAF